MCIVWSKYIMDDNKRGQAFNIIALGRCCVVVGADAAAITTQFYAEIYL